MLKSNLVIIKEATNASIEELDKIMEPYYAEHTMELTTDHRKMLFLSAVLGALLGNLSDQLNGVIQGTADELCNLQKDEQTKL